MASYSSQMTGDGPRDARRRIAVVEDDGEIRDLVVQLLANDGYDVIGCEGGAALNKAMGAGPIDLIVLDLMMPGEDGLAICRRLAGAPNAPAIVVVSARGEDVDRIVGLEIGADDYLAKPFNPRELTARVKSVLRRRGAAESFEKNESAPKECYRFAGWRLDIDDRSLVDPAGSTVVLSGGEFALLAAFVRRPRRVLTRDQLLDLTRGEGAASVDRAIDVQLSRLRRKLGDDPRDPALIKTVRGDGYLFAADVKRGGG